MADGASQTGTPPTDRLTHVDLYCLECGYNLRGLSGDPRRCPECGYDNPLGDIELPAGLIKAQLRKMETGPAMCAGAMLMGFFGLIPMLWQIRWELTTGGRITSLADIAGGLVCTGVIQVMALILWFSGRHSFAMSCLKKAGWKPLLWRYHLYAVATAVPIPIVILGMMFVTRSTGLASRSNASSSESIMMVVIGLGVIAHIHFVGRWAHRRATADIIPLQREVAVTLARQELQRKLRHNRGRHLA